MASSGRRPGKEVLTITDPSPLSGHWMGMGSSSSSCQSLGRGQMQGTYDVFISFCGTDVRKTFRSHLYHALDRDGIRTYTDTEDLQRGDEIDPSLENAIEDSRIAIVIFSENYASSRWCLSELAKIMECRKHAKLIVKPVFYRVDPGEMRTPTKTYAKALTAHEERFGKGSEKMKSWTEALSEAGNLGGWTLDSHSDEAEVIKDIVKDINVLLDRTRLDVAKYPVGIETQVEQIKVLLNLDSEEMCVAGLWGMPGVGKTTLAKATFNAIAGMFDGCAFLPNIREGSANPSVGLAKLQEKLLSEVLRRKDMIVPSVEAGISLIKDKLCRKKVLLLLDDISESVQLDVLAGGSNWFGRGSIILITTRNSSLLKARDIHRVYKVEVLQRPEALQLFSSHAFSENNTHSIRWDLNLIHGCLEYAKGLPLALVVLGSLVRNRPLDHWISTLRSLAESPHEDIDKVLRVSIDGLDHNAREVFLDIACFFRGALQCRLESIFNSCGLEASLELQNLSERSLIRVSEFGNKVEMHDLVQLMGRNIVKGRDPYQPRRRSRLWDYEDVLDVLSSDDGSEDVTGIVLCLPSPKEMNIDADAFRNMKSLRLLILDNVRYDGDPISFPSRLCWIDWSYYLPSGLQFDRKKERFGKLKHVDFTQCDGLTRIPDLSVCPNLEILHFFHCVNLVEVDDSIGCLEKLVHLTFWKCSNLVKLPHKLRCISLESMSVQDCPKLENFPEFVAKLESLISLDIKRCGITEIHKSVENLVSLVLMYITDCPNLVTITCSIYKLQKLVLLSIEGCSRLEEFPRCVDASTSHDGSVGFLSLVDLHLSRCNLMDVDFLRDANCFPFLHTLSLGGNNNLIKIPPLRNLEDLFELLVDDCRKLLVIMAFPVSLKVLSARGCASLQRIQGLSPRLVTGFRHIDLYRCPELAKQGINARIIPLEEFRKMRYVADFAFAGSEMPDWLQQSHFPDSVTFLVPAEVYSNVVGVVFCGALDLKHYAHCQVNIIVNGDRLDRFSISGGQESEMVRLWMLPRYDANRRVKLLKKHDPNHFRVSLRFRTSEPGVVKRCGFHLICKVEEEELRAVQVQKQNWPDLGESELSSEEETENDQEYSQDSGRRNEKDNKYDGGEFPKETLERRLKVISCFQLKHGTLAAMYSHALVCKARP